MVKEETRRFVEENREMLEMIAEHGSPSVSRVAEALLLAVDLERFEEKLSGPESGNLGSNTSDTSIHQNSSSKA